MLRFVVSHIGKHVAVGEFDKLRLVHLQERATGGCEREVVRRAVVVAVPNIVLNVRPRVPDKKEATRCVRVGRPELDANAWTSVGGDGETDRRGCAPREPQVMRHHLTVPGSVQKVDNHQLGHGIVDDGVLPRIVCNGREVRPVLAAVHRPPHAHIPRPAALDARRQAAVPNRPSALGYCDKHAPAGIDDAGNANAGIDSAVCCLLPPPKHGIGHRVAPNVWHNGVREGLDIGLGLGRGLRWWRGVAALCECLPDPCVAGAVAGSRGVVFPGRVELGSGVAPPHHWGRATAPRVRCVAPPLDLRNTVAEAKCICCSLAFWCRAPPIGQNPANHRHKSPHHHD
eukprot:m.180877 g.180877  ORF g.180877 m.180877 type:complete len:342 (-) comp24572_c0_seq1:25-1050(-)